MKILKSDVFQKAVLGLWVMGCLLWMWGGCRVLESQPEEQPEVQRKVQSDVQPEDRLEVLPGRVLEELTLRSEERPGSYELITDRELMEQAGIEENPAYVFRRADRELQVKIGAAAGFLALYGWEEEVRLVLQGYYFRDWEDAEKYVDVQKSRERRVIAFQRETEKGVWLLLFAADPEEAYEEAEVAAVREGLGYYARRLGCQRILDQFHGVAE